MSTDTPIGPGTEITLKFALLLSSGELIDSTGEKPATLRVGDGKLLPGFEQALFGLMPGAKKSLEISPDQGFGRVNPDNLQMLKKSAFARDLLLEKGLVISFADQSEAELPGVVRRVLEDVVEVDFNHPLAGKNLLFKVEILEVTQISNEIVRV